MTSPAPDAPPPGGADSTPPTLPRPRQSEPWTPQPLAPGALGADPCERDEQDDDDDAGGLFGEPTPPPLAGPLDQALTDARTALEDAQRATHHTATLHREQRLEALRRAAQARHVLDAALLRLSSTFTPDDVRSCGATNLADLLARHTGADPRRATADAKLAAALTAPPLPLREPTADTADTDTADTADTAAGEQGSAEQGAQPAGPGAGSAAVQLGRLGAEHAAGRLSSDVAALANRVVASLPAAIRRQHMAAADTVLAEGLPGLTYTQAQLVTTTLAYALDPDRADRGFDPDDTDKRYLNTTIHADGSMDFRGHLPPAAAAAFAVTLDHLSKPDPTVTAPTAADGDDGDDDDDDGTGTGTGAGDGGAGVRVRDERTATQRRADALETMARRAVIDDGTRAGEPPRVIVNTTEDQLADAPGAGQATCESTGTPLSRPHLLHLACAGVLQAVRMSCDGPQGAPLSLGRAVRIFTPSQRRAMLARDGGCAVPGCTAPVGWLEAHHVIDWAHGGPTDVDSGCLLCHRHHLLVTLGIWQVRMVDGVVQVRPPRSIDPLRRWLLNPRKALQDLTARRVSRLTEQLVLHPPEGWADEPPDPVPASDPDPAPDIPSRRGTCAC